MEAAFFIPKTTCCIHSSCHINYRTWNLAPGEFRMDAL